MTIRRIFTTLEAVETFHNKLYDQYSYVRCISVPFGEEGEYAWEVSE